MIYDFHTHYALLSLHPLVQTEAIDLLSRVTDEPPMKMLTLSEIQDDDARLLLLAQAVNSPHKERARVGSIKGQPGGILHWMQSEFAQKYLTERITFMKSLGLLSTLPHTEKLPKHSFALQFTFTLNTPYISKDDNDFYILDNPVKKEKIFKLPYVAPSQWKGALRATMNRKLVLNMQSHCDVHSFLNDRMRLYRLFGHENDGTKEFFDRTLAHCRIGYLPHDDNDQDQSLWQEKFKIELKNVSNEFDALLRKNKYRQDKMEGFQGHLRFFPSYFDRIGMEVINPHNRETGVGEQPIYFECVPHEINGDKTSSTFTLLYVPFDRIGKNEDETRKQVSEDLELLVDGIQSMFTTYGFGAKTSSGYGRAEIGKSSFSIKAQIPDMESDSQTCSMTKGKPELPKYLESRDLLHSDLRNPDNSLKSEEEFKSFLQSQGKIYKKKNAQLYEKAEKWWESHGKHLINQKTQGADDTLSSLKKESQEVTVFKDTNLEDIVNHVVNHLKPDDQQ